MKDDLVVGNHGQVEEDKARENPVSILPADAVFLKDCECDSLLKELNIQSFDYQKRSGNHVAVCCSDRYRFRLYQCVEHVNCTFRVHVVRRHFDGRKSSRRSNR